MAFQDQQNLYLKPNVFYAASQNGSLQAPILLIVLEIGLANLD